jgi:hypothetical protein
LCQNLKIEKSKIKSNEKNLHNYDFGKMESGNYPKTKVDHGDLKDAELLGEID